LVMGLSAGDFDVKESQFCSGELTYQIIPHPAGLPPPGYSALHAAAPCHMRAVCRAAADRPSAVTGTAAHRAACHSQCHSWPCDAAPCHRCCGSGVPGAAGCPRSVRACPLRDPFGWVSCVSASGGVDCAGALVGVVGARGRSCLCPFVPGRGRPLPRPGAERSDLWNSLCTVFMRGAVKYLDYEW
jgi:hypothetical protein